MVLENNENYHEIDFLIPAQRFNIQFSYVTQKGLPFIREFVLRLVHVSPMSKAQISDFFGLSRLETDEAISDLVERGELTLSETGRLSLTERSLGYFSALGEVPQLSVVQDSGVALTFDLETFSCLGKSVGTDKWKAGIALFVCSEKASKSEALVEKSFQQQFHKILEKELLPKTLGQNGKEKPSIYTVNSVNKIRQLPLRLTTIFKLDADGRAGGF